MTDNDRNTLIERLAVDVIGPSAPDEALMVRPSDMYLSGMLWPGKTRMQPEEDDRLAIDGTGGNDDAGAEEGVPAGGLSKPSSAGISFAVSSTEGTPSLSVQVSFGRYEKTIPESDKSDTGSPAGNQKTDHEPESVWQRRQYDITVPSLSIDDDTDPLTDLSKHGGSSGVFLYRRTAPWGDCKLVTLTLINDISPDPQLTKRDGQEQSTLFQTGIVVYPKENTSLIARPSRRSLLAGKLSDRPGDDSDDDLSTDLLYRNACEYAVGHTCSARWEAGMDGQKATMVATSWLPEARVPATSPRGDPCFNLLRVHESLKPLSPEWLATAPDRELGEALDLVPEIYDQWIRDEEAKIASIAEEYRGQARINLDRCHQVSERMRDGGSRIADDPVMAQAFRLANRAILLQNTWSHGEGREFEWRPFQIGFILMAAVSVVDRQHPDREMMDLLWFPTGGGKTEAYLGLVAFLAFYRRLSAAGNPDSGAGVAAVMRYTLRLLTTQQFARAAALILACEAIRRGKVVEGISEKILGREPFSIGLWVGGDATPNNFTDAARALNEDPDRPSPKQLSFCPACGKLLHWEADQRQKTIRVRCRNTSCMLHDSEQSLPVYTVDDEVYRSRPTLLIGTVDKFAQIVRKKEINDLFSITPGRGPGFYPPDLIIQDELHLIAGPLGTVAGLYEVAFDRLFTRNGCRPKIIGSTATIRRASDQVRDLFDRSTSQFPPPAIDAGNSGFAVIDTTAPGRVYVGVTTAGRSAKFTLQGVSASLLQSAEGGLEEGDARDHYWTMVAYFSSLRELGGALVLMQDDVNASISTLSRQRREERRTPRIVEELTSRRTQAEVRDMLDNLSIPAGEVGAMDVVLATNMLSVGVDIPRLGLMVVNGQPKMISEYIQATGRVGRGNVPGLIVTVLNNAKARDRSHFESFPTWHSTLYRDVEATSVTPFASRARDRALPAVLVSLVRHLIPGMLESPDIAAADPVQIEEIIAYVTARAEKVDPQEMGVLNDLQKLIKNWVWRNPKYYWQEYRSQDSLMQSAEQAATQRALGRTAGSAWPTMNNMRNIETSVRFRLKTEERK